MLSDFLAEEKSGKKRGGDQANWILVEEYISGKEVSIEGIVNDGKLKDLAIFDKPEPLEGPIFPETIFITPTILDEHLQFSLLETVTNSSTGFGDKKGRFI